MSTAENPIPKFDEKNFNDVLKDEIDHHVPSDAVRGLLAAKDKDGIIEYETDMSVVYLDILPKLKTLTTYDLYCYLLHPHDKSFNDLSSLLREDILRGSSLYVRKEMITLKNDQEGDLKEGLYKIFDKLYEAVRISELGHNKSPQDIEKFVYKLIIKISNFTNPMVYSKLIAPISFNKFTLFETSPQRPNAVLDFNFNLKIEPILQIRVASGKEIRLGESLQSTINYGCIVDDDCMRQTKLTDVFTLLMSMIEELYTEKEKEDQGIILLEELIQQTQMEMSLLEERSQLGVPTASSPDVSKSKPHLPLQHKLENLISEAIQSSLRRTISNTGGGRKYFSRKRKSSRRNKSRRNKSRRNKTRRFGSGY